MGNLGVCMNAGVGAPRPVDVDVRLQNLFQRMFQHALNRARPGAVRARRLHLPPFEERPEIREVEPDSHGAIIDAPSYSLRMVERPAPAAVVVTEIFRSVQGESTWAGLPCTFVRLTGCALRCVWCDSAYAFSGGTDLSIDEVLERVVALGAPLVEITGGEPLEQEAFYPLASALCDRGYTVLVETGGHIPVDRVDSRVVKILDVKCPGSGMAAANDLTNLARLGPRDEVKFVVADRRDFDFALDLVARHDLDTRHTVLISPVFAGDRSPVAAEVAEWVRDSNRKLRLNLQVHKFLWGDTPGR
jgi:7-carboxy-7-deazaguanine synthase